MINSNGSGRYIYLAYKKERSMWVLAHEQIDPGIKKMDVKSILLKNPAELLKESLAGALLTPKQKRSAYRNRHIVQVRAIKEALHKSGEAGGKFYEILSKNLYEVVFEVKDTKEAHVEHAPEKAPFT